MGKKFAVIFNKVELSRKLIGFSCGSCISWFEILCRPKFPRFGRTNWLDFDGWRAQKLPEMFSPAENFYARWRTQFITANVLRDETGHPSERLLQAVWQHQRLRRDQLKTTDGKPVRIFHPGFVSVEGGPDFGNAVVQTGDGAARSGDVEIDLRASGWRAHGHDHNPNFQNVILHVVWENDGVPHNVPAITANRPPTLILKNILDAPLPELSLSLENAPLRSLPENLRGKCCSPLRELDETKLTDLLHQAARVRFENKAGQICARAKNSGWEQALWESLFRALGYKHNLWPMQTLAEIKSLWSHGANAAFELQARLLGVSGLLPDQLTRAQQGANNYVRRTWDFWWRDRDEFENCILPRTAWKFHGLRPANHPQRRLVLAAHWLADQKFISKIENWGLAGKNLQRSKNEVVKSRGAAMLVSSLRDILEVAHDDFWSWHWTFRSARLEKPAPLLGAARVTDLAVNVILPWLWMRAVEGKNESLQTGIEQRYFAWPAAEDNSVLKLARQRLLGTSNARVLKTAAAQQGLMQIVRDFCEHSNAVCDQCRFPELVRTKINLAGPARNPAGR
jgi:hypothetical protein